MKVHLPALLAVVSVTGCFVACGASDQSRSDQDGGAGGEGGSEAGSPSSSGGSNSSAGSQNSAGTSNNASAGQAGEGGAGAAAAGGAGGEAGTQSGGAGGEGGAADSILPTGCPGVIGDYTQVEGTAGDDLYVETDLVGKRLVFSREGVDTFEAGGDGGDCLVGGPGDDHFSSPSEMASYFVGGEGADTYHIDTQVNIVRIVDMETADTIALSVTAFPFLFGDPGDTAQPGQVYALTGYSAGTASIPSGEGTAIVYDPTTGELWRDDDRALKGSSAGEFQLGTILNHDGYQFSLDDFVLE